MLALDNARRFKIVNQRARFGAVLFSNDKLGLCAGRDGHFHIAVDVSIGMARNGNRFLPVPDEGFNPLHKDGRTENSAIQDRADGSVGRFPHFFQAVFQHPVRIRRNGRAFYGDAVFFSGVSGVERNLVAGCVPVLQSQIIIFRFQVDIRGQQNIFNHFPDDSGHFVAVHFNQRRRHLDFLH